MYVAVRWTIYETLKALRKVEIATTTPLSILELHCRNSLFYHG